MAPLSGRLVVGVSQPLGPVSPTSMFDSVSWIICRAVYDTPLFPAVDPESLSLPRVVEVPRQDEGDARVFFAELVEGASFSDGMPVTAGHIVEAYAEHPDHGVRVTGSGRSLRFELEMPNPRFDLTLSTEPFIVRLTHRGAVGTGAYAIKRASEAEIVLGANEFSPARPTIGELIFRAYLPDEDGRPLRLLRALEGGEVDFAPRLSWSDLALLPSVVKLTRPVNSTGSLYFNTERLASPELRRALAAAIEPPQVARAAFREAGVAFVATHCLPPALGSFPTLPLRDEALARRLSQELKPRRPLQLATIFTERAYLPKPGAAARTIQAQLAAAGVDTHVCITSGPEEYQSLLVTADYDLLLTGNFADSTDPADFLYRVLASDRVPGTLEDLAHGMNFSRYRSPTFDDALKRYRSLRTPEALRALEQILIQDMPMLPLTFGRAVSAHGAHVQGIEPVVTTCVDFSKVRVHPRTE